MPIQHWSERIWVAQLSNEPALSEDLLQLREEAEQRDPAPHLVLDFSSLTHINSSNLSGLLRLRKLALDRDVRVVLAALPDSIWATFLTTGLDKIFEFAQDVPNALAGLQIKE